MKRIAMAMTVLAAMTVSAEWQEVVDEDLMAGTESVVLVTEAEAHQGALRTPALFVRDDGAFIYWGGYSLDRDTSYIIARFGDAEPGAVDATLSTTREATFLDDAALERMTTVDQLVVMTRTATERQMVAVFNVSGLVEKLAQLTE